MSYILNIETATKNCSVSLGKDGQLVDLIEYAGDGYSHAEKLHVFIQDIFKRNNILSKNLQAVAVSKGPGSYTGLRIGVSAAKGLSYSLQIPLIAVSTLASLARQIQAKNAYIVPMIDARRLEVYAAVYNDNYHLLREVKAEVLDNNSYRKFLTEKTVYFLGDAVPKSKEIIQHPNAFFLEKLYPSSKEMVPLSYQKFITESFENTAYFEPYYLKDFIITRKKNNIN